MGEDANVFFLSGCDVAAALRAAGRVYLVGHLQREQDCLTHVGSLSDPTEIGMTRYDTLTVDQPHLHTYNTDFTFVLSGTFAIRIIPTGEVRVLGKNGLCVIKPGVAHVCVASPGTQVLFVKVPGGNDKECVELDEASQAWVEEYCSQAEGLAGLSR